MVCKRELGEETRRPSGAIRGIHRGRLEAGIRADEVGEGEGRSRMGMMCCGKRVAWPPCGTRSPTKHCKLERRRTREVQRDGAETYIVFRCTRLRCAPAEEQTGRGGAVKRFREVSALLAVPVADHARRDGSSSPTCPIGPLYRCMRPARAPGLYSWSPVTLPLRLRRLSNSDSHRHAARRARRRVELVMGPVRYPLGRLTFVPR